MKLEMDRMKATFQGYLAAFEAMTVRMPEPTTSGGGTAPLKTDLLHGIEILFGTSMVSIATAVLTLGAFPSAASKTLNNLLS